MSLTPLPVPSLDALCKCSVLAAVALEIQRAPIWWTFAACLRLGFHALLRPKDIWGLRGSDVRFPGRRPLLMHPLAVVTVRDAKNRAFMGRLQVRTVKDPEALSWFGFWRMPSRLGRFGPSSRSGFASAWMSGSGFWVCRLSA